MAERDVEQKAILRRRMRLVRDVIDDRLLRSVTLWADVAALAAYDAAATVMGFAGVNGEPDSEPLVARLARDGKRLVLPRAEGDRIVPCLVGDGVIAGRFGVPEPQGQSVPLDEIDLVMVPGLAFTLDGARLGQGGGHYDRYLAELGGRCPTVGVCFTEQIVDDLPEELHDVRVHTVIHA